MAEARADVSTGGGRAAVTRYAPKVAPILSDVELLAWRTTDVDMLDLVAHLVAQTHDIPALPRPAALGPSPWAGRDATQWREFADLDARGRTAMRFAEQFTLDVARVDDGLRAELETAFGEDATAFAQAVYVADVVARARCVLDRLLGNSEATVSSSLTALPEGTALWSGVQDIVRLVPGLENLDVVTTELVRLRGARAHACRLCMSVRNRPALRAGANESTYDALDNYESCDFSEATKVALRLTDAFIWTPGRISDALCEQVLDHFSPAQIVELVLDIMRNATNKFMVSVAVDEAHVDGIEVYEVYSDGSVEFGLALP